MCHLMQRCTAKPSVGHSLFEIDILDDSFGSPVVSRETLSLARQAVQWFDGLKSESRRMLASCVPPESLYYGVSLAAWDIEPKGKTFTWYQPTKTDLGRWAPVSAPVILNADIWGEPAEYRFADGRQVLRLKQVT